MQTKTKVPEELARALRDCAHGRYGPMRTAIRGGAFGRLPADVRAAAKSMLTGTAGHMAQVSRDTILGHLAGTS